jgi:hypothetical protein
MKAAVRQKLLELIGGGHDLEAATAVVGIDAKTIQSDSDLMEQVTAAYRAGTAKLRAQLLSFAVEGKDSRTLSTLLEKREAAQASMVGAGAGQVDLDALSDDELDLFEACASLLEGKTRLDLSTYTAEQIALISGCLRGARSPVPRTSEQEIAAMRESLLDEINRHVRVQVEVEVPRPARVRPIDEAPVLDPEVPLPPSKAPAVRPAVEILPPARRNDSTGRPMALSDPGSPWYDGGARDLRRSERI